MALQFLHRLRPRQRTVSLAPPREDGKGELSLKETKAATEKNLCSTEAPQFSDKRDEVLPPLPLFLILFNSQQRAAPRHITYHHHDFLPKTLLSSNQIMAPVRGSGARGLQQACSPCPWSNHSVKEAWRVRTQLTGETLGCLSSFKFLFIQF